MQNSENLQQIAAALLAEGKGILAADESTGTANKRFAAEDIDQDKEHRRRYRELLFTAEGVEEGLSGVILYDETIRQNAEDGTPLKDVLANRGIIPGIKVDKGTMDMPNFPGEEVTEGLDGLRERLAEYAEMGARFTKWRGVVHIGEGIPTDECIHANAYIFAQYAAMVQEAGMVPIVEPEVLLKGEHTMKQCADASKKTFTAIFDLLRTYRVDLTGVLLKAAMVLPGSASGEHASPDEVAGATLEVLRETVPEEVPGVVFLSGGQSAIEATENLNAMARRGPHPWELTFSYARALQEPVMHAWEGERFNREDAQRIFYARVKATAAARQGQYDRSMEPEGVEE